jgi:RecB family endonuclease NucS
VERADNRTGRRRTSERERRFWSAGTSQPLSRRLSQVRFVIARCSVDYSGRLQAHLPMATRLLMVKADGSVLVHSDAGGYKPLMWI